MALPFDQDDEKAVLDSLRPEGLKNVRVIPREPTQAPQPLLEQLQDEVAASVEAVREELKVLVDRLDPILTPRVEEDAKAAIPPQGPRSKMAGSLAQWRDELLGLSNEIREVMGRVEL